GSVMSPPHRPGENRGPDRRCTSIAAYAAMTTGGTPHPLGFETCVAQPLPVAATFAHATAPDHQLKEERAMKRCAVRPSRGATRAAGGIGLCLLAASVQAAEFSHADTYELPAGKAKALLVADFDTDGRPDIAVALEGGGGKLALLLGGASGFV